MSDLSIELTAPNGRKYTQPTGLFINNEWVKSSNGQKLTSINPTNEQEIISVYAATAQDVDTAVAAARKALKGPWRDISPTERGDLMLKLSSLVAANAELLGTIETWDNGKIYADALGDVGEVEAVFKYYGGYADKIHGQVIDTGNAKFAYTIREPVGVCGQIIPWNYPLAMAAWKLGPALACGNTVVIKAAEQTPLSILVLANLIKEAGFPPGVVNILNGFGREAGAAIATHLDIDKVAFTGSTATGKEIMKMAAVNMKNITLETGGKSPLLVFDDADLDQAVKWAHIGIMSNQGQICTATSRILVQDTIYEKFVSAFKDHVQQVSVVGDPFAESTFQGPQVTKAQYERVLGYAAAGKAEGAKLLCGGEAFSSSSTNNKGYFIKPTVFTDVKPTMKIFQEEVFGPFVVIAGFKTEEEALELANNTTYGLGSAVFTTDITRHTELPDDWKLVWCGLTAAMTAISGYLLVVLSRVVSAESWVRLDWRDTAISRPCTSTWEADCNPFAKKHPIPLVRALYTPTLLKMSAVASPIVQPKKIEKKPVKFSNLLLGAGLNMFEVTTLGQPLEVTKTTMAANRGDSFAGAIARIWGRGGILGFYQGLIPWAWIEASTKGAVLLFVASEGEYYARTFGANEFGAGITGGILGGVAQAYATMGFCTCMKTVEITKSKVAATGVKPPGTFATFMEIYRKEGIRGINKGVNAVAIRQMTNWGSRFGLSRLAEQGIRKVSGKEEGAKLNAWEKIVASALGGGLSAWNQPIEVIRVEMQSKTVDPNRPAKMTVGNTFKYIYSQNGIAGLYRGVVPRIGLGVWQTVCMVALGDMAKSYVEKLTGETVTAKH